MAARGAPEAMAAVATARAAAARATAAWVMGAAALAAAALAAAAAQPEVPMGRMGVQVAVARGVGAGVD